MTVRHDAHVGADSGGIRPLISVSGDDCRECWTCARLCPAKAIRIVEGRPEVLLERCVACGLCVVECSSGCFTVRDDVGTVRQLLEGERPVIAIVATEFITALHPWSPTEIERRLESLGFHAVETTLLGEEMVARAYEEHVSRLNGLPLIRSTCPVVSEWVLRYRPSLSQALVPIVPPYIAQARLVKAVYPTDVAIVYVSPCFVRKDEYRDPQFGGAVDAVIDFVELAALLEEVTPGPVDCAAGANRPEPLKEISLTDGFPRAPLEARSMTATDVSVARGLHDTERILEAIEDGEVASRIVDLLNCEGCIDGPAVNPGMSVFAKRNIDVAEREARGRNVVSSRDLLRFLPSVDLLRSFTAAAVELETPTDEQIDAILADGGFESREEALDCRACGYRSCVGFASAVFSGTATWEMCFPLQRRQLREDMEQLATSATVDPVTGLWNRNALSERLGDEISRFQRYGIPVSLLMLDLDTFKQVNDEWGHVAGDQLLAAVGHLLAEGIRASDFAARYGGDEFAVVLPGTSKTEAYAVAEKIRLGVASLRVSPRDLAPGQQIGTTISVGVASAGAQSGEAISLLEAADRALYAAKKNGRNQVRLAPE